MDFDDWEVFLLASHQDIDDRFHTFAFECGTNKHFRIGVEAEDICFEAVHIKVSERQKIDLVDHNVIGSLEQFRIF